MPSKHLRCGSKTPDPEFPVVATSPIRVENLPRNVKDSTRGETMWDRAALTASTTMTGSPGQGGASHSCIRIGLMLAGSSPSSTNNRLRSTSSNEPCFKTFAGKTAPAMLTLMLASTAVRWAAVMTSPDVRYTPEPDALPFRIILAETIQGSLLSFRSAPSEADPKRARTKQSANEKLPFINMAVMRRVSDE